jgi:RNA polymerase sigma factor (sigma-70 family)
MSEADSARSSREVVEAVFMDPASRSRLLGYAMSRFGIPADDAEDLLQETALELLRQRVQVRRPAGFVFSVFHVRCCRYVEIQRARGRVMDRAPCPADAPSAGSATDRLEHQVAVRQAMRTISVPCRKILRAYYVEGLSLQETGRAIALAYSGVWKTINRCLRRLRQCLH